MSAELATDILLNSNFLSLTPLQSIPGHLPLGISNQERNTIINTQASSKLIKPPFPLKKTVTNTVAPRVDVNVSDEATNLLKFIKKTRIEDEAVNESYHKSFLGENAPKKIEHQLISDLNDFQPRKIIDAMAGRTSKLVKDVLKVTRSLKDMSPQSITTMLASIAPITKGMDVEEKKRFMTVLHSYLRKKDFVETVKNATAKATNPPESIVSKALDSAEVVPKQEQTKLAEEKLKKIDARDATIRSKIDKDAAKSKHFYSSQYASAPPLKFTSKLATRFNKFNSPENLSKAAISIAPRLKSVTEYTKMIDYFINRGDVDSAKKILEHTLDTGCPNKKLDRVLALAAKLGDRKLVDRALEAGAQVARNNKLVTNKEGFTALHFAAEGKNSGIIDLIAKKLIADQQAGNFKAPKDSVSKGSNGAFNPYLIRNDQTGKNRIRNANYIRPIHLLDQPTAKALDKIHGMTNQTRGNFSSSVSFYNIRNKITTHGFLNWLSGKSAKHHKQVELAAFGGKGTAGSLVVGISENLSTAANFITSGLFVSMNATFIMGIEAAYNEKNQRAHQRYSGASRELYLPGTRQSTYNQNPKSNHDIKEALQFGDFEKLSEILQAEGGPAFKKTTHEVILATRQVMDFDSEKQPELKTKLFKSLIAKIDPGDRNSVQLFDKVINVLYRRNENVLAAQLLEAIPKTSKLATAAKAWIDKFKLQMDDTRSPVQKNHNIEFSNKELEKAIRKLDNHAIQHIIENRQFHHTSKAMLNLLERYPPDPRQDPLNGKDGSPKFFETIYAGLAKQASPAKLERILTAMQGKVSKDAIEKVLKDTIDKSLTQTPSLEHLKVCVFQAVAIGSKPLLDQALGQLKQHFNVNIVEMVDAHGLNILHQAAKSNVDMVKHILNNTSIIEDFNLAEDKYKKETGLFGIKIRSAQHVMEIPTKDGMTPTRMLNMYDSAAMDKFSGNIAGFRAQNNTYKRQQEIKYEQRCANALTIVVAGAASYGLMMYAIPFMSELGEQIGKAIVDSNAMSIAVGGVLEGATAVTGGLAIEKGILHHMGRVGVNLARHFSKAFNGSYMEANSQYHDQIITKTDQLITQITNATSNCKSLEEFNTIVSEKIKHFKDIETNPAMKEIRALACNRIGIFIAENITTDSFKKDANDKLEVDRDKLLVNLKSIFNKESLRIENKASLAQQVESIDQLKTKLDSQKNRFFTFNPSIKQYDKILQKINNIQEKYVSQAELDAYKKDNPKMTASEKFNDLARMKAKADYERKIQASVSDDDKKLAQEQFTTTCKNIDKITSLSATLREDRLVLQAEKFSGSFEKVSKAIEDKLIHQLRKIEGGSDYRLISFLLNNDRSLSNAAKNLFKSGRDDGLEQILQNAAAKLSPQKALELRQAIADYKESKDYLVNIHVKADESYQPATNSIQHAEMNKHTASVSVESKIQAKIDAPDASQVLIDKYTAIKHEVEQVKPDSNGVNKIAPLSTKFSDVESLTENYNYNKVVNEIMSTEKTFRESMSVLAMKMQKFITLMKDDLSEAEVSRLNSIVDRCKAMSVDIFTADKAKSNEEKILNVLGNEKSTKDIYKSFQIATLEFEKDSKLLKKLMANKAGEKAGKETGLIPTEFGQVDVLSRLIEPIQRGPRYILLLTEANKLSCSLTGDAKQDKWSHALNLVKKECANNNTVKRLSEDVQPLVDQLEKKAFQLTTSSVDKATILNWCHKITEGIKASEDTAKLYNMIKDVVICEVMKSRMFSSEKDSKGEYKSSTYKELIKFIEPVIKSDITAILVNLEKMAENPPTSLRAPKRDDIKNLINQLKNDMKSNNFDAVCMALRSVLASPVLSRDAQLPSDFNKVMTPITKIFCTLKVAVPEPPTMVQAQIKSSEMVAPKPVQAEVATASISMRGMRR